MRKLVAFVVVFAGACGDDGNTSGIPDACNPIDGHGCMLPWPSSTYLKKDATSATETLSRLRDTPGMRPRFGRAPNVP